MSTSTSISSLPVLPEAGLEQALLINEAVNYLAARHPADLDALREQHPGISHELAAGIEAGGPPSPVVRAKATVMLRTLETLKGDSARHYDAIQKGLRFRRRIQLWSKIITAVSSSSALALALRAHPWGAGIASAVALLASIVGIMENQFAVPLVGNVDDVPEKLAKLLAFARQAEFIAGTLAELLKIADDQADQELWRFTSLGNQLMAQVNQGGLLVY